MKVSDAFVDIIRLALDAAGAPTHDESPTPLTPQARIAWLARERKKADAAAREMGDWTQQLCDELVKAGIVKECGTHVRNCIAHVVAALVEKLHAPRHMSPWWMVLNPYPNGPKPTMRYDTFALAAAECQRVANMTRQKCHVLEKVATFEPDAVSGWCDEHLQHTDGRKDFLADIAADAGGGPNGTGAHERIPQ